MAGTVASLVGSSLVNAGLGALFWWLAARLLTPDEVGFAAAAISAMLLLAALAVVGLGSVLTRELPRHLGYERAMLAGATVVSGAIGLGLGVTYALVIPSLDPDMAAMADPLLAALFAIGVAGSGIGVVLDNAALGLLRPSVQLARNTAFSVAKVLLLGLAGWLLVQPTGDAVLVTWVLATTASLAAVMALRPPNQVGSLRDGLALLRRLNRTLGAHHALNLALQLPPLGLPVAVALVASPQTTASFYIAWLIAGFVFFLQLTWAQTLYAHGSNAPERARHQARTTIALGIGSGALGVVGAAVLGTPVLALFGSTYADDAGAILPVLVAASIPLVIKDHYHVLHRIHGSASRALALVIIGGVAEIVFAAVGAASMGLSGLAIGFLLATCAEAVVMGPAVVRFVLGSGEWRPSPS